MADLINSIQLFMRNNDVSAAKNEQLRKKLSLEKLSSTKSITNLMVCNEFVKNDTNNTSEIYEHLCKELKDNKKKILKLFAFFFADINFLSDDKKLELVDNIILPCLQRFEGRDTS